MSHNKHIIFKKTTLALSLAMAIGVSSTVFSNTTAPALDVQVDSGSVTAYAPASGTLIKVVLRVAMPDGSVEERTSDSSSVSFDASSLADGSYRYETWALLSNQDGKYTSKQTRGKFKVSNGAILQAPTSKNKGEGKDTSSLDEIIEDAKKLLVSATTTALDFAIPSAHAANLTASSTSPVLDFEDTSTEGSDNDNKEWRIIAGDDSFSLYDDSNDLDPSANITEVIRIEALGEYGGHPKITNGNTKHSILIEDTGDMTFADGKMFLNKLFGNFGLGTITPSTAIHAVSSKQQMVRLENPVQSTWDFGQMDDISSSPNTDGDFRIGIDANGNGGPTGARLSIKDENGFVGIGTASPTETLDIAHSEPTLVFHDTNSSPSISWRLNDSQSGANFDITSRTGAGGSIQHLLINRHAPDKSLRILQNAVNIGGTTGTTRLGIGTETPAKALHIVRNDGKAAIRVVENAGTDAKRYLIQLENNGATGTRYTDHSNGVSWQMAQTNSGGFVVSNEAAAGQNLVINNDGSVFMGPNLIPSFQLSATGNLAVTGSVTANGILLTSSRSAKTDIEDIKPSSFMDKLRKIEVAEWRYKNADKGDRHISPMAEDFYSLFQLGPDNKHINPNDLASVAIVAAKELQIKTDVTNAETAKLKAENMLLKERLASLEKLVTNLAYSEGVLPKSGSKVAFTRTK